MGAWHQDGLAAKLSVVMWLWLWLFLDRLCSLLVGVPGYRFRGPGCDSRGYQIFWEIVDLERGPLSLVSTTEELLGRKSSGSCPEIREYGHRDPSSWPRGTFYPKKLALTSSTRGGRSVGIVRSRIQATEYSFSRSNFEYCRVAISSQRRWETKMSDGTRWRNKLKKY
jgi:hypothetical protein